MPGQAQREEAQMNGRLQRRCDPPPLLRLSERGADVWPPPKLPPRLSERDGADMRPPPEPPPLLRGARSMMIG